MTRRTLVACFLALTACSLPEGANVKVIVGARLEASQDAEPIPYSVVVVADGKIRAAGPQSEVPVPKGSEITRGNGKILRPAFSKGKIAAGEPADLILRDSAAPGSPQKLMHNGEWIQ